MMKEFDECPFTGKFEGEHTMCMHVRNCMCMGIQSNSYTLNCDVQIKYCYVNC